MDRLDRIAGKNKNLKKELSDFDHDFKCKSDGLLAVGNTEVIARKIQTLTGSELFQTVPD